MPYKTNADLPEAVRSALPGDAQSIWRDAYTAAEKKWPGDKNDGRRASYAWGAVKSAGYSRNAKTGKWSKPAKESGAPAGSYEERRDALHNALKVAGLFFEGPGAYWYIQYVYDDSVVVDYSVAGPSGGLWRVPYTTDGKGSYAFGQMAKVELKTEVVPANQAAESAAAPFELFGHRLVKGAAIARESGPDTGDLLPVRVVEDTRHKPTDGDYHIVIVGAGANEQKRRAYPNETIESVDLSLYDGRKMYLDHDVRDGEAGGVRSVRDYAAQVTQPWLVKASENAGVAEIHAIAHVFPDIPGFSANMKDPVYRKGVATSHVFGYKGYLAREDSTGHTWEVITSITAVDSVDWVTEPGARGRVAEHNEKENEVDLTKLTTDELRTARPDLIQEIADGAVAAHRARENDAAADKDLTAKLAAEQTARATAEAKLRTIEIGKAVETAVTAKDSGIPETVRSDVTQELTAQVAGLSPDKTAGNALSQTVKAAVEGKAAFLKKLVAGPDVTVATGKRDGGDADGNPGGEEVVRSWFR